MDKMNTDEKKKEKERKQKEKEDEIAFLKSMPPEMAAMQDEFENQKSMVKLMLYSINREADMIRSISAHELSKPQLSL